jgi:YHS domain-containing protein
MQNRGAQQREREPADQPAQAVSHLYSSKKLFLPKHRGGVMAIDPICGTQVDEETTEFQTTYGGKDFYFCSEECETKFDENPAQYAAGAA